MLTCLLALDDLEVGGIGAVVETLANGLTAHGVRPVVLCRGDDGRRAARLREGGVEVRSAHDEPSALAAIGLIAPAVIQSHSASPFMEQAAIRSNVPLIPVMHNTEIHYTSARWAAFATLMAHSVAGIAVSDIVRAFHLRHIGDGTPVEVIPNGAADAGVPLAEERREAREALSRVVGAEIAEDVVFVSLARYDAQKNIAGLVASFAAAAERCTVPMRLVCAGDPSDWLEWRRADAIRRSRAAADRIHLLGNSDARTLLTAADVFVLDSFFEGWPVAATEAAAFGRPLLLSDVGGARELVSRDAGRSVVIPNPTGEASLVSDARVRVARFRSSRQANLDEFCVAVATIAETVIAERTGQPRRRVTEQVGVGAMIARHAEVILDAARTPSA
ncbi:glycosyltransferase [Microbacterium sp. CJ88]|uniref:glycosyltransferase n=1 Tax=Microbacterium sp. CJ88 TaxID=3445672 RepID=UPI003F65AFD4